MSGRAVRIRIGKVQQILQEYDNLLSRGVEAYVDTIQDMSGVCYPFTQRNFNDFKPKILIIEDDDAWRRGLTKRLEGVGYFVEVAKDRSSAKVLLKSKRYNLVLLDLCLDGTKPSPEDHLFWEFLQKEYPEQLVTAITGYPDPEMAFGLARSDSIYFIDFIYKKNFDFKNFSQRIRGILQTSWTSQNTSLLRKIDESFNIEELKEVCFLLGIDHENILSGESKKSKIISMLLYCQRHDKMDELVKQLRSQRSNF